jgi:hypothetical protein
MSKFTETIDLLKSASAWDKFSLKRFGVEFDRTQYTPLNMLIRGRSYYDPETATTRDFLKRAPFEALLTVGYNRLTQASEDITEEDLKTLRTDESVEAKHYKNPLASLMLSLVNLLETDSQESQDLAAGKGKRVTTIRTISVSDETIAEPLIQPTTPPQTQPHFPTSFKTPDSKRKISETSFGTRSTESTPNRLVHAEAKVQSLQNTFVQTIIKALWFDKIVIPWAQGRVMFLTYAEFFLITTCS